MKYDEKGNNILDGRMTHKDAHVPFDAHEQATRGTHVPTAADEPAKPEAKKKESK